MRIDLSELYPYGEITKEYRVCYDDAFVDSYTVKDAPEMLLKLVWNKNRKAALSGEGSIVLEMPCDRCLKPVSVRVEYSVDMTVDTQTGTDGDGDDVFFLEDDELLVNELLLDEIRMNLPMKVLCRENCKGICMKCGADLNNGKCSCEQTAAPTKMAEALSKAFADAMNKS